MAQNLPASLSAGTPTEPWKSSLPGGNIRCYSLLDGVYFFLYVILSFSFICMFVSECLEQKLANISFDPSLLFMWANASGNKRQIKS